MNYRRNSFTSACAPTLFALYGLVGCLHSEPNKSVDNAVVDQNKQVSAQMDKPYLLNEKGEVISSIHPEVLAAIKEDLRNQSKLGALSNLESLFDSATGNLKDADRLPDIQLQADNISLGLSKGAVR